MSFQTTYKHSHTNPVRGREIDVNFEKISSTINFGSQFSKTASATVGNNAAETTILGTGVGSLTIPANTLIAGRVIRISVAGVYSTIAVPGTLQFRVRLGGVGGTLVLDSGAQTPPVSVTNGGFDLVGLIQVRSIGASGTVFSQGKVNLAATAATYVSWDMENTATTTIDTTVAQAFQVTVDWQTADVGNTITASVAFLEILGG